MRLHLVASRIEGKYDNRLSETVSGESSFMDEDQFIGSNLRKAMESFYSNPITGSGIGAFGGGIFDYYEIHSTYFKMIGETGILGVLAYIIFMSFFFKKLKYRFYKDPYREFLYYCVPFIIGCMVSWAYTYHMRKREFWIMFAIIFIIDYLIRNNRNKSSELNKNNSGFNAQH